MLVAEDWEELAVTVLQIGYQNDLSYFYLGRAAEGMKGYDAALKYYRISGALATGPSSRHRCYSVETCDGFRFPQDLGPRIAAVQSKLNIRKAGSAKKSDASSSSQTSAKSASSKDEWVDPPAASKSKAADDDEWITPPPVVR